MKQEWRKKFDLYTGLLHAGYNSIKANLIDISQATTLKTCIAGISRVCKEKSPSAVQPKGIFFMPYKNPVHF